MSLSNLLKDVPGRKAVKTWQSEIAYDIAQWCSCIINNAEGCIIYMFNIGLAYEVSSFLQFVCDGKRKAGSRSGAQEETWQCRAWEAERQNTPTSVWYARKLENAEGSELSFHSFKHSIERKKKVDVYFSLIPSRRPLTAAELARKHHDISGTSTSGCCFNPQSEKGTALRSACVGSCSRAQPAAHRAPASNSHLLLLSQICFWKNFLKVQQKCFRIKKAIQAIIKQVQKPN